jgi:hypothetical protein
MVAGDIFPPLQVIKDDAVYWLVNGAHTLEAARQNGYESIRCEVREGDRRAALLASTGTNAEHGLRRTIEDKRRAVSKLLNDAEWSRWSDREVARQCRVSHTFVGNERSDREIARLTGNAASEGDSKPRALRAVRYRERHGKVVTMKITSRPITHNVITIRPQAHFGENEMAQLERLAGAAGRADRAFAGRLKKVALGLQKTAERLESRKKSKRT